MKTPILIFTLLVSLLSLSACSNTLDGAGRDISKAGQKISDTF